MAACFTEVPFYSLRQPELGSTITNSLSSERLGADIHPQSPSKAARKERRGRGPVFVVSLLGLGSTARRPRQSGFFHEATQIVLSRKGAPESSVNQCCCCRIRRYTLGPQIGSKRLKVVV